MGGDMRVGLASSLVLVLCAVASAQDAGAPGDPGTEKPKTEKPASRSAQLDELERRVAEQEKQLDALRASEATEAPKTTPKDAVSAEEQPKLELGYKDGFFLKGKIFGGDYEVRPRAKIELDYRAFPHAAQNDLFLHPVPQDEFLLRRAWLGFSGRFSVFSFDLELNLAAPTTQLLLGDFWFQYDGYDAFKVRFGHLRVPFGLEDGITPFMWTDTIERAMVIGSGQTVAPDLRPAVQVFGKLADGLFNYWFGAANQQDTNTAITGDPLAFARVESDVAKTVFVGASGLWTRLGGPVQSSFAGKTPGQFQFFAPVNVRGREQVYGVDAAIYRGPFWFAAEYVWAQQERQRVVAGGADGTPLITQGGYATVGYMFLGPPSDSKGPHKVFEGWQLFSGDIERKKAARNVGLEVLARFEWMSLDQARGGRHWTSVAKTTPALSSTAPDAASVKGDDAKGATLGLNLDAIENVRFMVDYIHLWFGDQTRAERPHSRQADELLFRAQLEF